MRRKYDVGAALTPVDWLTCLSRTDKGVARPNLANAVMVLQKDPVWNKDVLWYDEFLDRVFFHYHGCARPWRDEDAYTLTIYMQTERGIENIIDSVVWKAAMLVAKQRTRHCVREWMSSLVWDGEPRIEHAFEDYWGAAGTAYTRAASANFFIGMAARIFLPGCKLDTMPVFEGPQGIKKSSALQVLGQPWYGVTHERVGTKDFLQGLPGFLILEISELQSFSRAEVNAVKGMMSSPADNYRPSYGRAVVRYPRQCVFAGTTNADDWGTDDTGLRRFHPIRCGEINLELLAAARPQLFAEAVAAYHAGATWWEMPLAETLAEQADRQFSHAWTEHLLTALALSAETTVAECLTQHLKFTPQQITRQSELTVGSILRVAGWTKKNLRRDGRQGKIWVAPDNGSNKGSDNTSF